MCPERVAQSPVRPDSEWMGLLPPLRATCSRLSPPSSYHISSPHLVWIYSQFKTITPCPITTGPAKNASQSWAKTATDACGRGVVVTWWFSIAGWERETWCFALHSCRQIFLLKEGNTTGKYNRKYNRETPKGEAWRYLSWRLKPALLEMLKSVQPVLAFVHIVCVGIGGREEIQENNQDLKAKQNHYFFANYIYFKMLLWRSALQTSYWCHEHSQKCHFVQRLICSKLIHWSHQIRITEWDWLTSNCA